jgi:hypothetical protein
LQEAYQIVETQTEDNNTIHTQKNLTAPVTHQLQLEMSEFVYFQLALKMGG